jgi:transcriptional regulator with XRE-family HTH domain
MDGDASPRSRLARAAALGQRVRAERLARDPVPSVRAIARDIGISHSELLYIEQGKRLPSQLVVVRLARRLGMLPENLLLVGGYVDADDVAADSLEPRALVEEGLRRGPWPESVRQCIRLLLDHSAHATG